MLTISDQVVAALSDDQISAFRQRVVAYLRECAPKHVSGADEPTLLRLVATWQDEAEALGLLSEQDIARWCFLETLGGGKLFAMPAIRDQFDHARTGRAPTEMLDLVFEEIELRLRR